MKTFLTILIILISIGSAFSQWIKQSSPTQKDLYDIRFLENRGVIVGDSVILTSNDSGNTWFSQNLPYGLERCSFQDKDTVWAVGVTLNTPKYKPAVLKSTDSGNSWEYILIADTSTFRGSTQAVNFYDKMHGWIGGWESRNSGFIFKTANGGQTWDKVNIDSADISEISFVDTLNGWASSWNGRVFNTTDGGNSWNLNTKITISGTSYEPMRRIFFTTKDSGWTAGGIAGDQTIARTTDGGMNWIIDNQSTFGSSLHGLFFIDSKHGWTVGGANAGLKILHTTDGGINWSLQTQPYPVAGSIFYFESVYMFDLNNGFVVGDSGAILKTTNGNEITAVNNNLSNPSANFELFQNYPNPFNPSTKISYNLPSGSFVTLAIYDNLGRKIITLVNNYQNAGLHSVTFEGKDLPSGIYYYKLKVGDFRQTKKLILLK